MSGRHSTSTSSVSRDVSCDANNNALLSGDNLLRLALKKPDSWNWELTTSSSSPNISFPKIQLFDGASGELMVEVAQPDCVIRSDCSASIPTSESPRMVRYGRSRTSLVKEKRPTSGDSLADIFSQLSSKGLGHKLSTSGSQYRLANGDSDPGRRVLQKSKSANAIAAQEAPVVRRKSRRSVASRSSSILERISEFYGRSSTDDDDSGDRQRPAAAEQQQKVEPGDGDEDGGVTIEEMPADPPGKARPKIYKLVRSNAGTLMVREESFHTQRSLRRRQREVQDGDSSQQQQQQPQISEQYVELDKQPDRPAPDASRYEQEINHIDHLLSRVMLSHDLQTEEDAQRQGAPNIRISPAPDVATLAFAPASHHLQNGRMRHTRRPRRSVSVGSSLTSSSRHRSISSGRSNSPAEQRIDRRRRSSSSSSEEACASRLFNDPSTGSSSRSNSLKRRGRTRRRGDPRDSSTGKSNALTPQPRPHCPPPTPPSPSCPLRFAPPVQRPVNFCDLRRRHRRRCRSVDCSALALASFRQDLPSPPATATGESTSRETASLIDIDVPTIGAIGTVPSSEYTPATSQCPSRPCSARPCPVSSATSGPAGSSCSSSSSVTLSSLSPLSASATTSSASVENPPEALVLPVVADSPPSTGPRELARSSSVPCGDRSASPELTTRARSPLYRRAASSEVNYLLPFRDSVANFPLSGDILRNVYMMQEPGDNQPPAPKRQLLTPPEQPQEVRELPPQQTSAGQPAKTYAEVLNAPPSGPSTGVQAKPPSGLVRPRIRVTSAEDVEFIVESGFANTVEPPMRTNRTLKYYVRRHRASFHKE
uniref:Uncharacterized protein n=1 Tax=Anopheles atroparvus TaxID=41427 RepID=A0A182J048_ANOAO